jgi:hypothetical protein
MKSLRRQNLIAAALVGALALSVRADDDVANEFRSTLSLHHLIKDDLTGYAELQYRNNPDKHYQAYEVIWPSLTYSASHWLQLSGGLLSLYTDNEQSADKLELQPFAGVKLFVLNKIKWTVYSFTRYEFLDTENLDTHAWTSYSRVRSRFGVEFPLTTREQAWQPKTWYGLADVEPIYRFDHDTIDPVYVRGGFGYVLNHRVRLEFIYTAQFSRSSSGELAHAENLLEFNLSIGWSEGLLRRLRNPRAGD